MKGKHPSYVENINECVDGVMEQFRLLRGGKGDTTRASVMNRTLSAVVSVGNLAAKLQKFGHTPSDLLRLPSPSKASKEVAAVK
jgi:hypothetical protein